MGIKSSIIDDVERKQLVWYVQRMDRNRLSQQIMEWILLEK